MAFEKDPNEIGALWSKSGAKGEYLTGTIEVNGGERNGGETIKVVCFAVKKSSDKSPAWRVLKSVPREGARDVCGAPQVESPDSLDIPF